MGSLLGKTVGWLSCCLLPMLGEQRLKAFCSDRSKVLGAQDSIGVGERKGEWPGDRKWETFLHFYLFLIYFCLFLAF